MSYELEGASAAEPALIVDSATGVDVHLRVAGPGARGAAFMLDWLIRVTLAVSWYVIAAMAYNGRLNAAAPVPPTAKWLGIVLVPSIAIYFLYHYLLEIALHGRTPGKRMTGIRIVTRAGSTPSPGALLARNVFRLIDSFPLFYTVALISTMITRDHVRIGDLAAGTLVVYERARAQLPAAPASAILDAAQAELIGELLQRWQELAPEARQRIARLILTQVPESASPVAAPAQTPAVADAWVDAEDRALRARLQLLMRGQPQ